MNKLTKPAKYSILFYLRLPFTHRFKKGLFFQNILFCKKTGYARYKVPEL